MYPVLFDIRGFEVTSFGAMLAVAALVGSGSSDANCAVRVPESAVDAALAGVLGGVVGAKLLWVVEHLGSDDWTSLLFSRGGLSWFGGFVGGVLAGMFVDAATAAVGHGDDRGRDAGARDRPCDRTHRLSACRRRLREAERPALGDAFPKGLPPIDVPVHPTMVYEAVALLPIAAVLFRMRGRKVVDRSVVGAYS